MGGKTSNIVFNTFISALRTVVAAETQVHVSRYLSEIRNVFASLAKAFGGDRVKQITNFGTTSGRLILETT